MLVRPRYEGPPVISMDGPAGDQLAPVVRQRRRLEAMLADLGDDDWRSASRCDAWTVQDVVAHLTGVNVFWHASVRAGRAGTPTRVLTGFDPATTPALMVDSMRGLAPEELLGQFRTANDAFLDVLGELDDAGWAALAETPAGHLPIRLVAQHGLWDCWIHERDIALPLGLTPPAEPDEVRSSLRYAAALGPAFAVTTGTGSPGMPDVSDAGPGRVLAVDATDPPSCFVLEIGDGVAVRDGAAPLDAPCLRGEAVALLEGLSLRTPLPASTPTEWLTVVGGLATAFDVEVPTGS